jgi:hypothetical protein
VATGAGVPEVVVVVATLAPALAAVVAVPVVAAPRPVKRRIDPDRLLHADSETAADPTGIACRSRRRRLISARGPSFTPAPSPLPSWF